MTISIQDPFKRSPFSFIITFLRSERFLIFKSYLDVILCNLLLVTLFEQGGWSRWCLEVPSNFNHSVIMWFCVTEFLSLKTTQKGFLLVRNAHIIPGKTCLIQINYHVSLHKVLLKWQHCEIDCAEEDMKLLILIPVIFK